MVVYLIGFYAEYAAMFSTQLIMLVAIITEVGCQALLKATINLAQQVSTEYIRLRRLALCWLTQNPFFVALNQSFLGQLSRYRLNKFVVGY